jgi:hypothetical protein
VTCGLRAELQIRIGRAQTSAIGQTPIAITGTTHLFNRIRSLFARNMGTPQAIRFLTEFPWRPTMKRITAFFQPHPLFVLAAALSVSTAMLAAPAYAATAAQPTTSGHVMPVAAHPSVDTRINSLHTRLQITAAQESLWQPVAQIMRDNASKMDALNQTRAADAKSMSAVDDLRSYGQLIDAHADAIKKFTPAFEALYNSMSDTQKSNADLIFRGDNHHKMNKG